MELHSLDIEIPVFYSHNYAVFSSRCYVEHVGNGFWLNCQRVVAHGFERLWESREDALAVVVDRRRFSVPYFARVFDHSTKCLCYALVAQTDAKHRYLAGEVLYDVDRYAGIVGGGGTGRDDAPLGLEFGEFDDCGPVVANHLDLGSEF